MSDILELGREVIGIEIEGLQGLQLDESFEEAVRLLTGLKGKVVLTGVGKSGIIAQKIAATMVSIGTPAMFMHPVDGLHGDLGVVLPGDIIIILSNSGNTKEISDLLDFISQRDVKIIAITGGVDSILSRAADITISSCVAREACKMGLAPTTSTTAQLAIGDALAVTVSAMNGFGQDDFREYHPAGALGQQLMQRISQVMISGAKVPVVAADAALDAVLAEMTAKSLGLTLVGAWPRVEGIVTDGDLRRTMQQRLSEVACLKAGDIMTVKPSMITSDKLAIDALDLMERKQITSLLVGPDYDNIEGVVHLHDLLGRGHLGLK